jgi:hypothetical protein
MKQTFSISMTIKTEADKEVTEAAIRRLLSNATKFAAPVTDVTFEVVDMTDSLAYKEQLEADRRKAVGE